MDNSIAGRLVFGLARVVAIAGGIVLALIAVTTLVSIAGRALIPVGHWIGVKLGPIPGDFELVQAGVLFAVFAFLPWCHLTRGHAIVGIFTDRLSVRFNVVTEALMDLLMLLVAVFIAWRHWDGMMEKFGYRETTLLLRIPLWWIYAAGMIGAVTFVIVAAYCLVRSVGEAAAKEPKMPESGYIE